MELIDPSVLSPDIAGTGEVQVFEKTPTPTPVTDMVEHKYNQYDARGNFVAAVTRKRIESELTGGIRDISKPVSSWDKGLHQYRVGISGLRILEQLITQNQTDASGSGGPKQHKPQNRHGPNTLCLDIQRPSDFIIAIWVHVRSA